MTKVMYPTNRPFADRVSKKTAYKINRNTKFYKTLLDFDVKPLKSANTTAIPVAAEKKF